MPTITITNGTFNGTITYPDAPVPPDPQPNAKLEACVKQNTKGQSEAFPLGVPHDWDWYPGKTDPVPNPPPSGWHALTGWGQIYCEEGQSVVAGDFWIKDAQSWVRNKTTGVWTKTQDQSSNQIYGSSYPGDFQGSATSWKPVKQSDNSMKGPTPTSGRNVHWYHQNRGTFDVGTVDACYVQMDCKVSGTTMRYVVNAGCDWWESTSATMDINPGAGMANWVKLTTSYRTCYFMSIPEAELRANPPPPLK